MTEAPTSPLDGNAVALNHWRTLLARTTSPSKRLDLILSDPLAPQLVPALPVEDFYYLIKGIGLDDSVELLEMAAPEQIRGCLDFELWDRDKLSPRRVTRWMQLLCELDGEHLDAAIEALDVELVALLVSQNARVYDRSLGDEIVDESPYLRYETPDTFFVIEFTGGDNELTEALLRLIDRLYQADQSLGRKVIMDAKWGLRDELEEDSYRWRNGRMADLGFVEYYEAVEVYRYLDPEELRRGLSSAPTGKMAANDEVTLPAPFARPLAEESFLGNVLASIEDQNIVESITAHMVALFNRVLTADRVDPSDMEAVQEAAARARDLLSTGLEYLAQRDESSAGLVLLRTSLTNIFRAGISLAIDQARRARKLRDGGSDDPNLDPLLQPRPQYPRGLDEPAVAGVRPFRRLADVERVAAYLDTIIAS